MFSVAWSRLIPIGTSEPVSIVREEPADQSSMLVSPSKALQRRFVLCLTSLESQAGRDLVPRFDRVEEPPARLIASLVAG